MTQSPSITGPRKLLQRLRDVMAGHGSAQDRLDRIVRIIAADMVAEVCSCYLMRAGEVLELFATQGLNPDAVHKTRLRVNEGLVGYVAGHARPLNLADAQSHPLFAYRPETGEEIYQSLMGVPILRDGRVVGVLVVQNVTRRHYDEEEVEALQVVAMVLAELVAGGELVDARELFASEDRLSGPATIEGLSLMRGIAMGTVVLKRPRPQLGRLVADDPAEERARLTQAVAALQAGIDRMLDAPEVAEGSASHDVLETYRMFARDSGWLRRIEDAIGSGLTAEAAVIRVQEDNRLRLAHAASGYLRERLLDLEELGDRLLHHLAGAAVGPPQALPDDIVLVARSLGPADLLEYDRAALRAVVLEEGSTTMHLVIVARAFEIPVVGQVRDALSRLAPGETVLVDGNAGRVTARPSDEQVGLFRAGAAARAEQRAYFETLRERKARTRDGIELALNINVGLSVDADQIAAVGADGVGLCRTEIPFMVHHRFPDVAAQASLYRAVLDVAGERPVMFRTLDIGGDKRLPYLPVIPEENPAMGWRAVRIGLDQPAILRHQLRALVQAAAGRALNVMFPMVAIVDEFLRARALLSRELDRARALGSAMPKAVRAGVMLEVPALMWQLPALLSAVDFVSVGTNDLVQFLFASDRGNPLLARRYGLLSPATLALLRDLVAACEVSGVALSVCGEAAGEPLEAMAMIGVGVRSLSMPPGCIGPVKAMCLSLAVGPLAHYLENHYQAPDADLGQKLRAFARDHGVSL